MNTQTGEARHAHPGARDIASAVISTLGFALSLAGFTVLVVRAAGTVNRGAAGAGFIAGVSIYGACLLYRFAISSIYRFSRGSRTLGSLDDAGIFFLVPGTLMPILFSFLSGPARWIVFALALAYAAVGYLLHLTVLGSFRHLVMAAGHIAFFLAVPAMSPIREALGDAAFAWFMMGGVLYLAGFLWKDKRGFPYADAVWLSFALAGSLCQYFGISAFPG